VKLHILNLFSRLCRLFVIACIFVLCGCSSTPEEDPRDPIEPINRAFWTFTWDYTDKYITKPASIAYTTYTPLLLRSGLYNMALNLNEPSSIINNILQAKISNAVTSTKRFLLNSTIGLFGFFDPASDFGWTGEQEEFGEVLGLYGLENGPYFIVPGLGPTSVREEFGDYVDKYYWPLAVINFWPNVARSAILGLEQRAALADQETLIRESFDNYEFVKNAYFQNMNYKIYDGNPPVEVDETEEARLDAFMDEFDIE
jgi:phospholipid-binding lipoprotein MlaA